MPARTTLTGPHVGAILDANFDRICAAVPEAASITEEYLVRIARQRHATETAYEEELARIALTQEHTGMGGDLHLVEFKLELLRKEAALVEEFHARMTEAIRDEFTIVTEGE
jgi:hypothetical protein